MGPEGGKPVIKSTNISAQIRWGIGSGFNNPCLVSRHTELRPQTIQFRRKYHTSFAAPGQKNYQDNME
jgi:hypothetical protein